MELFLIRHGQSANNALPDQTLRVEDPVLTTAGELQAEQAARHLAARRHLHADVRSGARPTLDRLYCSPMIRAMQTARPIARALGLPVEVWVDIHEIGGIASLAHPGLLRRDEWLPPCVEAGLDALEAYHSDHDAETRRRYLMLAGKLGVAVSGGSDYHADESHGGVTLGSVSLPVEAYERLVRLKPRGSG